MRVECSHCKALNEVAGLSNVAGGLGFICPGCGGDCILIPAGPSQPEPAAAPDPAAAAPAAVSVPGSATRRAPEPIAAAPAPAPPSDADRPLPSGYAACPKCGALHATAGASAAAESCARCGLVFAKLATGQARLPPPPPVADALRTRWEALRENLDDHTGHLAFIEACGACEALEFAGHAYRGLTPPGHHEDPRVSRFRERVLRQATARAQMLIPPRDANPELARRRSRMLVAALVVTFFFGLFAAGYWYFSRLTSSEMWPR